MPAHELQTMDAERETVLLNPIHLRRQRNLLVSPLFRLPFELILEIFLFAVQLSYCGDWVTHTAICHRVREMLIHSPLPWRIIHVGSVPLAKLFLERCNFDPHTLFAMERLRPPLPRVTDKTQFWEELKGRTLNNLRFFMFQGIDTEFENNAVDLLRRTPNLSTLEIESDRSLIWFLEWPLDYQLPNLTMLRIKKVAINWNAPILRNLTKFILDSPHTFTSVKTFLSVLKNCPDLESLHLISTGPSPRIDTQHGDEVVPLQKLEELFLRSVQEGEEDVVACILSHIWFPESTVVQLETASHHGPRAAISRILPPPDAVIFQRLRKATIIAIDFGPRSYQLVTDNFRLVLTPGHFRHQNLSNLNLEAVSRFVPKVVEIIGGDTVITLHVRFDPSYGNEVPRGVWEALFHGFPHLELISYDAGFEWDADAVDPFSSVLCEPFEGRLVCPQLRYLRIPRSFTQGPSAAALNQTLLERAACGRGSKEISINRELEDELALLGFFSEVDEVCRIHDIPSRLPPSVSGFLDPNETPVN